MSNEIFSKMLKAPSISSNSRKSLAIVAMTVISKISLLNADKHLVTRAKSVL
jgi:hypothetical protein